MRRPVPPTLTPVGRGVAVAALATGALGRLLGYRALTLVALAAVALLVLTGIATRRVPRVTVARSIEPARVERGMRAYGLVSVRNGGRRRSGACAATERIVAERAGPGADGRDAMARTVRVQLPALAAGRAASVPYELPTTRRGALRVGPLALERRDPFGLWQARRPVGDAVTLLVHPRIHAVDPRRGGRERHLEGPVSDTARNGTLTFHSLREYSTGDDIRRVHWKSSARTGTLMVREHVDTSLPSTVLVLDTRADRYQGDGFEEAVDVAASVVAASHARGFPVRLLTGDGVSFVVRAGQRGQELRDFLTGVQPTDRGDLRTASVEVLRGRDHDALVVVSGAVDASDLAATTAMARRFASPSLVTIRPAPGAGDAAPLRWGTGAHLDGPTAQDALVWWRTAKPVRATAEVDR